ncbi:MAG: hypothetical protein DDT32_00985 [Syntrophomonadaceae bacterium]|nr:hypothetical protein [Bacillota bacterium]MBT9147232.1 hypothetical protein [Bacillota bacterium]
MRYLAIIGLAKNAGKTVAFNTIVKEATVRRIKLGMVSYGRDGEEIDILTRQEKPRIYIPPDTVFASARKALEKSDLKARILHQTGFNTLLGEVYIYRTEKDGGYVELVGVNSGNQLKKIKELFSEMVDLMIVDGALDRRSSAVPSIADGLILSTGAVVGNTEDMVTQRTLNAIDRLNFSQIKHSALREKIRETLLEGKTGIIDEDNNFIPLPSHIAFVGSTQMREIDLKGIKALILDGALIDSFAEEFIFPLGVKDCKLIVRDEMKVFLNKRNLNLLRKAGIDLHVMDETKLVAVTVNPISPYGINLDSNIIVSKLRETLKEVPVYDLLGKEYLSLGGDYFARKAER